LKQRCGALRRLCVVFLCCVLGACIKVSALHAATETATLNIQMFTSRGEPLSTRVLGVLTNLDTGQRREERGSELTFHRLPWGRYEIRVEAAGFSILREMIVVHQSNMECRLGLLLGVLERSGAQRIQGTVLPRVQRPADLWVRLMPLYSGRLIGGSVDARGRYSIEEPPIGRYLLVILDGNRLLKAEPIDFLGGILTLDIDIDGGSNSRH
jgi:hypothetical protein